VLNDPQAAKPHQEVIQSAWDALTASWDSDDAHRKFLALCESFGRLDAAGLLYRKVAESTEPQAEDARKRIDQLMVRAMANVQALRKEPNGRPRSLVFLLGVVLVVVLMTFAASFFF
jgi:hypothetical protein